MLLNVPIMWGVFSGLKGRSVLFSFHAEFYMSPTKKDSISQVLPMSIWIHLYLLLQGIAIGQEALPSSCTFSPIIISLVLRNLWWLPRPELGDLASADAPTLAP